MLRSLTSFCHPCRRANYQARPVPRGPRMLSVVDGHTGIQHLVALEAAERHRRSGRFPALCDAIVVSASLTTPPARHCPDCAIHQLPVSSGSHRTPKAGPRHGRRRG